jgi:hypothetical protein
MDSAAIEAQEVCAYSKKSEEMKMATLSSKSIYQAVLARAMVWGALAVCLTTSPLLAQNIIGGKFTLKENARFGDTVLAAGRYTFSIEPVGTIQSIRSIQQGAGHLVLVVLRPERSGSVASIFAMASRSSRARESSELVLEPEKEMALARTMYLEKQGLEVDFDWSSPKNQSQAVAQRVTPQQSAAGPRTGGTE